MINLLEQENSLLGDGKCVRRDGRMRVSHLSTCSREGHGRVHDGLLVLHTYTCALGADSAVRMLLWENILDLDGQLGPTLPIDT